jgi:L-glyceraldehyde 3-phosphate reductase
MARATSLREDVLTPAMMDAIRGLNSLAESRGQSLAQMALSWLLNDTRTTSVIIGTSSVAQLKDDLKALDNCYFSEEELRRIEEISAPVQLKTL